jgi:hypothetical protein
MEEERKGIQSKKVCQLSLTRTAAATAVATAVVTVVVTAMLHSHPHLSSSVVYCAYRRSRSVWPPLLHGTPRRGRRLITGGGLCVIEEQRCSRWDGTGIHHTHSTHSTHRYTAEYKCAGAHTQTHSSVQAYCAVS